MSENNKIVENEESFRSNVFNKFKFIIIPFMGAFIPATIYFIGFSYHSGHLEGFGIENEFFQRNAEYYFMQGYYIVTGAISSMIYYVKLLLFIFGLTFSTYFYINLIKRIDLYKKGKKGDEVRSKSGLLMIFAHTTIDSSKLILKIVFATLLIYIFVIFYYMLFGKVSNEYGISNAQKLKNEFIDCDLKKEHSYDCVYIVNDDSSIKASGIVIASSDESIALWTGDKAMRFSSNNYEIHFKPAINE